jgi:hypothetical protein
MTHQIRGGDSLVSVIPISEPRRISKNAAHKQQRRLWRCDYLIRLAFRADRDDCHSRWYDAQPDDECHWGTTLFDRCCQAGVIEVLFRLLLGSCSTDEFEYPSRQSPDRRRRLQLRNSQVVCQFPNDHTCCYLIR